MGIRGWREERSVTYMDGKGGGVDGAMDGLVNGAMDG